MTDRLFTFADGIRLLLKDAGLFNGTQAYSLATQQTTSAGAQDAQYPAGAAMIPSSAATLNPTTAKASGGKAFRISGNNVKASVIYCKFYDKASAPNPASDVPAFIVPIGASAVFDKPLDGFVFANGISFIMTTDPAQTGNTALAVGDIMGFSLLYA